MKLGLVLMLAFVAAAPTSQPTSRPAKPLRDAKAIVEPIPAGTRSTTQVARPTTAAVALADAEVAAAASKDRADAAARELARQTELAAEAFATSDDGKSLRDRVATAETTLAQARRDGSAQDKLDASSAFNKARAALNDARDRFMASRPELQNATRAKSAAAADLAATSAALDSAIDARAKETARLQAEREARDPIAQAIKRHELVLGMTLPQARLAMGKDGEKTLEDSEMQEYTWKVYVEVQSPGPSAPLSGNSHFMTGVRSAPVYESRYSHTVFARFRAGRIIELGRL